MAKMKKGISRVRICQLALPISHLLFIDDRLLFCEALLDENRQFHQILKEYVKASGQLINHDKISMSSSKNVLRNIQENNKEIWGFNGSKLHEKYLGLLALIGKSRKQTFAKAKTNVWQ